MPIPCWSYLRVSTGRQAGTDRSGLARQEEALARWLAEHPSHQLQEALLDAGVSGGGQHRRRGALGSFIAAAQSGTVPPGSVLIVESLTRFSREAERQVLGVLLNDFWANDLGLAICGHDEIYTGELIDSQPHRLYVLLALMQQSRAEWLERSRRSTGARKAQRAKQDAGIRTPGRVPFWIQRDEGNRPVLDAAGLFMLEPQGAATIRRMVELHLGGNGGDSIARHLNAEGHPVRSTAEHWRGEEVRKLLRSPAIKGTLVRKAGNVDNYFPAVVDSVTFERIQQVTASRGFDSNLRGTVGAVGNLFQGVSRCSECGGPVSMFKSGSISHSTRAYVGCRTAIRLKQCSCRKYVPVASWEPMGLAMLSSAVWEKLLHRPEDRTDAAALQAEHDDAASRLIELRSQLTLAEGRAEQAWLSGAPEERQATIERTLAKLRAEIETAEAKASATAQQLASVATQPSTAEQAERIRQRLAAFRQGLNDSATRQQFNRWLKSHSPPIKLLLHPEQRMQLVVGDTAGPVMAIDEGLARIALHMGGSELVVDPRGGASFLAPDDPELDAELADATAAEEVATKRRESS